MLGQNGSVQKSRTKRLGPKTLGQNSWVQISLIKEKLGEMPNYF